MQKKSRCSYCGSLNFGKGCRYGPHGVHFHPNDSTKCAYCNSSNYGKGCTYNPTSDLHVHGITFNAMYKENVQSFLDNKIFIRELKKDFTEFRCFQLGIINEHGEKIKSPLTEEENNSFSPFIRTLLRLKRYLGSKIDLIDLKEVTENQIILEKDLSRYKQLMEHKEQITEAVNHLYSTLDKALEQGFSLEEIKKLISA